MTGLKLGRLPDRAPIRLSIGLPPELHCELTEYAELYRETYGQEESLAELIPYMLRSFLDSDRGFARARRSNGVRARSDESVPR